jgi:SAM-dependent methyltransferase
VSDPVESERVAEQVGEVALWQDVECGSYAGDLETWRQLAAAQGGPVLELGCGVGRVALELAGAGHEVTGLEREPELVAELLRRARARRLAVGAIVADASDFKLQRRFALILGPMQLAHLLGGPEGRRSMLRRAAAHLAPRGRVALALLSGDAASAVGTPPPLPDVLERDGWIYSSLPIEVRRAPGGLEVRRLRQAVSADGDLSEELDVTRLDDVTPGQLEAEALDCGLRTVARLEIPETPDHVGSTVVVLERG